MSQMPFELPWNLVLGSGSPRRKELLEALGFPFRVEVRPTNEAFDSSQKPVDIARALAENKAAAFGHDFPEKEMIITADTIVVYQEHLLNKPASPNEARQMLQMLNGNTHSVFTGVCLKTAVFQFSFVEETVVSVRQLPESVLDYYVRCFHPLDKAGAYGIQEFYGMAAVASIKGCYYNVMGLPTSRLFYELYRLTHANN